MQVNVHQAKTHLSRLLERARAGDEVIIAKNGEPIARLVPVAQRRQPRTPGSMKGKIRIAADFDAPLPKNILSRFHGRR